MLVMQKQVSDLDRERAATRAAVFGLRVSEHLEGGADELLTKVKRRSFHKLQTLLIYYHSHAVPLENPAGVHTDKETQFILTWPSDYSKFNERLTIVQ